MEGRRRWYLALVADALDRLGEQHLHCEGGEGDADEGDGVVTRGKRGRGGGGACGHVSAVQVVAPSFFTAAFLAIMTAVPLGSSSAPPRADGGRRSAPHAQASRKKLTRIAA